MSYGLKLSEATIRLTQDELLSSLWYSDGSGARHGGVGIEDTHEGWRVVNVRLVGPSWVEFDLKRDDPTTVQG